MSATLSYYELLEIAPTASVEEVKRAFRVQIAKYHPDKVHHLGKEFQAMAADRAAELTEAYRILSDAVRRAEYDRTASAPRVQAAPVAPADTATTPTAPASDAEDISGPAGTMARSEASRHERATRDAFMRRVTMDRFRQALESLAGDYDEAQVSGFDVARVPRARLFSRGKGPRLLARFAPVVDAASLADAWTRAAQSAGDETCVFLIGSSLASSRDLAVAVTAQRRKHARAKVTLIPVDARDWAAHLPTDAPDVAKALLARLRE